MRGPHIPGPPQLVEPLVEKLEATLGGHQRLVVGKAAGGGERATATATVAKRKAAKRENCATHWRMTVQSAPAVFDWVETAVDRDTQTWPNLVCISPDR